MSVAARLLKGCTNGTYGRQDPTSRSSSSPRFGGGWPLDHATADDPAIYPNMALSPEERLWLVTYVQQAGVIPDRSANQAWADWDTPSSRAWTALVPWQALDATP